MTIAVTGHRDVIIDEKIIHQVDDFFIEITQKYGKSTLLSALADGADQLVARRALQHTTMSLEVPLPMKQEVYEETLADKKAFLGLLGEATLAYVIPKAQEHPYENLGHYLVDNSDVLLALWDDTYNEEQGGTGDVVKYAKSLHKPIIHLSVTRKNN